MQNPLEKHCCKALLQLITSLGVTHWSAQAYTSFQKPPQAAQSLAASLYPSQTLHRGQKLQNITKELSCKRLSQFRTPSNEAQTAPHGPRGLEGSPTDVLGFGDAVLHPEHCHKSWGQKAGP